MKGIRIKIKSVDKKKHWDRSGLTMTERWKKSNRGLFKTRQQLKTRLCQPTQEIKTSRVINFSKHCGKWWEIRTPLPPFQSTLPKLCLLFFFSFFFFSLFGVELSLRPSHPRTLVLMCVDSTGQSVLSQFSVSSRLGNHQRKQKSIRLTVWC